MFELTHSKLRNEVALELGVSFLHAKEKLAPAPPAFRKCGKSFSQYVVLRNINQPGMGSWIEHYGGVHFTYAQFVFMWSPCGESRLFREKFGSSFEEAAQDISDVAQIDAMISEDFERDMDYMRK